MSQAQLPDLTAEQVANGYRCHCDEDGICRWMGCPQNRDGEPARNGRQCPLLSNRVLHGERDEETGPSDDESEEL